MADAGSASLRLAAPAPWWIAVLAFVIAWLVPAWRRSPLTALPAALSAVPWLPVPMPVVALLWSGPLAWLPIACAVLAAIGPPIFAPVVRLRSVSPGTATWLAGTLSLILGITTAWGIDSRLPGGDEPHYLIITQSLLLDGDLRIQNNHDNRDYAAYFGGDLTPDVIRRGQDGEVYSIHAPGVAALVAPAFRVFGYRGAQATVLLLAALTGALIWRVAFLASGESPAAAWFAWCAVAGSATLVLQSAMVFPDGPGALAVISGCWLLVRLDRADPAPRLRTVVGVSVLLAALPWLHTRFVILAFGFGVAVADYLLRDLSRVPRDRLRRVFAFFAVPAVSALAWFGFFFAIYGTPNPTAPYGDNPESSLSFVPGGLIGLLFDQQFGLVATTPVLAAAVVGLGGNRRRWLWYPVLIAVAYLLAATTYWMWWAGRPATPARFATAVLPALALPIAWAWHRSSKAARAVWLALLGWSLATSAALIFVGRGALAWNDRDANARILEWLGPTVDLSRGWPSFFWRLDPTRLSTEWPFVVHSAVWLAIPVLLGGALVTMASRKRWQATQVRLASVAWLLLSMACSVQVGWWLNGSSGLDPARSQTALLAAAADHDGIGLAIGAFAVRRTFLGDGMMLIRPEAPGRSDSPPSSVLFAGVPPGLYDVRFDAWNLASGQLLVRLQRESPPMQVFDIESRRVQEFTIDLPGGARGLVVEPDSRLRRAGGSVTLVPRALYRGPAGDGARATTRYGDVQVFFEDDGVFAERDGFWVRGGRAAALVLVAPSGREAVALQLQNGTSPNTVEVAADGEPSMLLRLDSSEARQVMVGVGADGRLRVTIRSAAGFRPSDGGGDTRYLGVWIVPR